MSQKNTVVVIGVLLIIIVIGLFINFLDTTKTKTVVVEVPNKVIQEEKHEEVIEALRNPKTFTLMGEVVSVDNSTIQVKPSPLVLDYQPKEGNIIVNVDDKSVLLSVSNKEPAIYEKEIREFVDAGKNGIQPKIYTEKEVALNELKIGDIIIVLSYNEISTTTTSFLAKIISIYSNKKNLPQIPEDLPINLPEIPENNQTNPPEIPRNQNMPTSTLSDE